MKKFSPEYFAFHLRDLDWHDAANIPGADPQTYRPLNHCWFVDKDFVYFEGRPLKNADPASFRALNEMFALDGNKVYSKYGDAGCVADLASFQVLDEGFFADDYEWPRYGGYARDDTAVFFAELMNMAPRKVKGADPTTFVSLGYFYGKDGRAVYLSGKAIPGAIPEQFDVLNAFYSRDAERAYYVGRPLPDASPQDLEVISRHCARDKKHVYSYDQIIPKAEAHSYQELDGIYIARDRHHVFVSNAVQTHIDIDSFQFIGHDYFADKSGVYWQGKRISGVDLASFRSTGYGEAEDRHGSYRKDGREQPVEQSWDPAAFEQSMKRSLIWSLIRSLGPLLLKGLWSAIKAAFGRGVDTRASAAAPQPADILLLAEVLAMDDQEALQPVRLAVEDPEKFIATYSGQREFCDEPSYSSILDGIEESGDLDAFRVMREVYGKRGLIGYIDWRSETSEIINQVDPMLRRFGIHDFDWSFVDRLETHGDGSELRNNNFLNLLRDRLHESGLTLAHLCTFDDSYSFAVLRIEAFEKINGMQNLEMLSVSDDFGPDEGYMRAQRLLRSAA